MISYRTRSRKLRVVTDHLGFFHPLDLLYHYQDREIVPGICTDQSCDCIMNVARGTEAGICPACGADSRKHPHTLGNDVNGTDDSIPIGDRCEIGNNR